jgi:hypothetical protein
MVFKKIPCKAPGDQVHQCNFLFQTWFPGSIFIRALSARKKGVCKGLFFPHQSRFVKKLTCNLKKNKVCSETAVIFCILIFVRFSLDTMFF